MTDWILKALGADIDAVDSIVDWSLRWQTQQWGVLAAVLLAALAPLTWWLYRKSPQELKPTRRLVLTCLRIAFLALLLAILLQPVLLLTLEREVPRTLPVLIDTTGSMDLREVGGGNRLAQVRDELSAAGGQAAMSSLEEDMEVPRFVFSGEMLEKQEGGALEMDPTGDSTALGDTLMKALERFRGAALAGFVVVTDGGQNDGIPLARATQSLKEAGVPVYAIGVGRVDARDVALENVEVREVLLADDAAPVTVRLRSQGMKGESGRVVFSLGGVQVAEEEVNFANDGLLKVNTLFIPKRTGEYPLEVRFESNGVTEALTENNAGRAALRVVDRKLRVLLVDQAPRWEYKYLEAMLLRERRVDLSAFLFEGDREIARVPGSPYLEQFPLRAEDLFEFDLVILGDIDPRFLTEKHQELLRDYVSTAGGALVVVAGKRFLPSEYRRSVLELLLPVELAGTSISAGTAMATRPVRLSLTEAGRESVMLRLGDEVAASEAIWRRLPALYWTARVKRAKPAAEVLLSRPDPTGESETTPVLVLHRYGAGEVLFVGTDNFWRWRRNVGDRYHAVLWGQIIQRMAGQRLLTENPRVTLQSDRRRYRRGDRVKVYGRIFTRNWEPREDEVLPGVLVSSDDPVRRREVSLRSVPGQRGIYRAEFSAGDPGNYRLALPGDQIATLDFTVRDDNREHARAAMNADLLRELARQTGGAFLTLAELEQLPAAVTNRSARLTSLREVDLWSSPLIFALLVLLITIEWIVRKVSELK